MNEAKLIQKVTADSLITQKTNRETYENICLTNST